MEYKFHFSNRNEKRKSKKNKKQKNQTNQDSVITVEHWGSKKLPFCLSGSAVSVFPIINTYQDNVLEVFLFCSFWLFIYLFVLKKGFSVAIAILELAIYRSCWPLTRRNPSASASGVLELRVHITIPHQNSVLKDWWYHTGNRSTRGVKVGLAFATYWVQDQPGLHENPPS